MIPHVSKNHPKTYLQNVSSIQVRRSYIYTPKTNMTLENRHFNIEVHLHSWWIFQPVMLVFGGVIPPLPPRKKKKYQKFKALWFLFSFLPVPFFSLKTVRCFFSHPGNDLFLGWWSQMTFEKGWSHNKWPPTIVAFFKVTARFSPGTPLHSPKTNGWNLKMAPKGRRRLSFFGNPSLSDPKPLSFGAVL